MKKNNKQYALKEMSKVKIIDRRSEKSIKGERDFLSKLHNPFIVNMICAFQDYDTLYLVMDLLTGGDLRYHLCRIQKFSEEETKFFIACVLLGLEYIHGNNIIHRDIKPENLVCDDKGYIRITDFGVAKIRKEDNSSETSGTPGYMAPEVLLAQNHSFPVDFFAIGIMGYEFMLGERPYMGRSRKEIKHLVLRKQAKIEEDMIPYGWTYESVDFINRCLKRKYSKRLGYVNGVAELKEHIWFYNFSWDKLYNKKLRAPFIPKRGGNYDKKYCEAIEKITDATYERYQSYANRKNFGEIFAGYTFINYELIQNSLGIETHTTMSTITKQSKMQSSGNLTINNEKKKLHNIYNNINIFNYKGEKNYSPSSKEKYKEKDKDKDKDKENNNKYTNIIISDKETIKEIAEDKAEKEKEKEKIKIKVDEQPLLINSINIFNTPQKQNKKEEKNEKNEKKNNYMQLRIDEGESNNAKNFDINNNKNNPVASNNNSINNNIKKISSLNGKAKLKIRSTSVDATSINLKNSLSSYNINYIKSKNKELYLHNITNNINKKNITNKDNKNINDSLSNTHRDKFSKLRNNTGLRSTVSAKRNIIEKREISGFYKSNSNIHIKNNNYIKLKHYNLDDKNKKTFYLPNLNKNASMLSIYGFKKKSKLNLNNLKININYNFKNDFLNNNNKIKISPTNKKLKKSGSTLFLNSIINSTNNKLKYKLNNNDRNSNKKLNFFNPISLRGNYSNKDNVGNSNKRSTNSANKKLLSNA